MMRGLVGGAIALVLAAVAVALVADGTIAVAIALTLAGSAGVLLVAAVFYAVGRSEDEDRARGRI